MKDTSQGQPNAKDAWGKELGWRMHGSHPFSKHPTLQDINVFSSLETVQEFYNKSLALHPLPEVSR